MRLVILRHIGRRDENGGLPRYAQFGNRSGAGPGKQQVGHGIGQVHPLDEIRVEQIRYVATGHEGVDPFFIVSAALPDYLVVRLCRTVLHPVAHDAVQRAAAQAAADHEERLLVGIEPVEAVALFALFARGRGDLLADRIAREQDPVGREETLHPFVCRADLGSALGEHLVGQARERVLLLQEAGDTLVRSTPEQRTAGIATHAHRHVGLELLQDVARLPDAFQHLEGEGEVLERERTLQSGHGQADDLVARRGHALHLHLSFGADKENLRFGAELLDRMGNRQGGEDVSAGSAAADDDSGIILHGWYRLFRYGRWYLSYRDCILQPVGPPPLRAPRARGRPACRAAG